MNKLQQWIKYKRDLRQFIGLGGRVEKKRPMLREFEGAAGEASGHYFHQDLLIAQFIHRNNPFRHIDVGSSIGGFVSHVASFREIEVFDIRPLKILSHPNIIFKLADLSKEDFIKGQVTDSLSSLHALEHFGLGRYGDTIDPLGHIKGFNNMLKMVSDGGLMYVSFPISWKAGVHFNAHRVFDPNEIFDWPSQKHQIELVRFDFVDDLGNLYKDVTTDFVPRSTEYGCGIYTLLKKSFA